MILFQISIIKGWVGNLFQNVLLLYRLKVSLNSDSSALYIYIYYYTVYILGCIKNIKCKM